MRLVARRTGLAIASAAEHSRGLDDARDPVVANPIVHSQCRREHSCAPAPTDAYGQAKGTVWHPGIGRLPSLPSVERAAGGLLPNA